MIDTGERICVSYRESVSSCVGRWNHHPSVSVNRNNSFTVLLLTPKICTLTVQKQDIFTLCREHRFSGFNTGSNSWYRWLKFSSSELTPLSLLMIWWQFLCMVISFYWVFTVVFYQWVFKWPKLGGIIRVRFLSCEDQHTVVLIGRYTLVWKHQHTHTFVSRPSWKMSRNHKTKSLF